MTEISPTHVAECGNIQVKNIFFTVRDFEDWSSLHLEGNKGKENDIIGNNCQNRDAES